MSKYSSNPVGHRFDGRRREGDGVCDAVDEPREHLQPHGPLREGVREPRRADTSTPRHKYPLLLPLLAYSLQSACVTVICRSHDMSHPLLITITYLYAYV